MHKFSLNRVEFPLLVPAILIVFIGLSSFYSFDTQIFYRQLLFLGIGLFSYLVFINIDYKIFGYYSKFLYYAMIASLLLLFVVGLEARGAVRWIDIFGFSLQFSEIIKPFFIIFMAKFLTSDDSRSFKKFFGALALSLPIFILTLRQPDLGNAMIYAITVVFMLFIYGFPFRYFAGLAAATLLPFPIVFNLLHDYQRERILTFLDPTRDPFGSSYNVVQSLISIGSGGFFGKGFGQATQSILRFLPETHTDFVFATISENLGFIGGVLVVLLFGYLLMKIYKISEGISEDFSRMTLIGIYFIFLTHIFLNIGMNLGIVPIVGITLPFASYGGSSLLTSFIMLGIVSSIKFEYKKKGSLEIR